MRTRSLTVLLVGLVAVLGPAVRPAAAQSGCPSASSQYPPNAPGLQLSASEVFAGDSITVSGTCFTANSVVAIEFRSAPVALGSAQTNALGSFSRSVTIPAGATPGLHTIVASDGRFELTAGINVLARAGGGGLARTGAAFTIPFSIAGAALLAVGTLIVLATRRKRAAAPTA